MQTSNGMKDKRKVLPAVLAVFFLATIIFHQGGYKAQAATTPNIGTVIGGAIGGAVGNQLGSGAGKKFSTVLGALGGAYLGNILGTLFSASNNAGKSPVSSGGNNLTFGGKLLINIPPMPVCSCSAGFMMVTVGAPKGGTFIMTPATKIFSNGRPVTGSWVIGDYTPGGACLMWVPGTPPICVPVPAQGLITRIGTS